MVILITLRDGCFEPFSGKIEVLLRNRSDNCGAWLSWCIIGTLVVGGELG